MLRSRPWLGWPLWNICFTNDHGYVPLVVNTSQSFPHSRLITGFVTRLTRRVPLAEQELLTLLDHLNSPPVFSEDYSIFSFICMFCRSFFVLLYFFLLAIVLSVLLRYTVSDCPFGIFKLFFYAWNINEKRIESAFSTQLRWCGIFKYFKDECINSRKFTLQIQFEFGNQFPCSLHWEKNIYILMQNKYITSVFHWNVTIWWAMKWSHDYKRDVSHPNEAQIRTCTCLHDDVRCKQSMA
jgi:hypothetical protein